MNKSYSNSTFLSSYSLWVLALVVAILFGLAFLWQLLSPETDDVTIDTVTTHHKPNGGFRNPTGSLERAGSIVDIAKFVFQHLISDRMPNIPTNHVLQQSEILTQIATVGNPSVTWLGHATFIIRISGKVILTDPFLSENAGPAWFGAKRFVAAVMRADELPKADVMVVSHNHYDHLDADTISAYPYKEFTQIIVPLGIGSFFTDRGYQKVIEHDWWDSWQLDNLTITTLPAVHSSRRGLFDHDETLWASFAITSTDERIWFSGDTALGEVFSEIGHRFGPFDLALIGIGAYEPRKLMEAVHASPEDAVAIARAVKAKKAIGMHWGTIMLTPENPFEAPARFHQAAIDQGYGKENAWILKIGESRTLETLNNSINH